MNAKHTLRHTVGDALDKLTQGRYKGVLPQVGREYVTTLDDSKQDVVALLGELGYEYQALAAVKVHDDWGRDIGSYAKTPGEFPEWLPEDSAMRQWEPEQTQYHVHLYETDDGAIAIYSHYEIAAHWSVDYPEDMDSRITRLVAHYNPINEQGPTDTEATYWFGAIDARLGEVL